MQPEGFIPSDASAVPPIPDRQSPWIYALSGGICLLALTLSYRLWEVDLGIPLHYMVRGDAFLNCMVVKSVEESGWYLRNPSLGAPGVQELHDFPWTNDLNILLIKFISLFTDDHFTTLNVFYLSTFLLTNWTALFAFRALGASGATAVFGSLLYAFLPYHYYRGQAHLFLSAYYGVPLIAAVALKLCEGEPFFFARAEGGGIRRVWSGRTAALGVVSCVVIAGSDVYYSFFGAYLVVIAGLVALGRFRCPARLLDAAALLVLISALFALSISPSLLYAARHGGNDSVTGYSHMEADVFGLRIANLLKPSPGHRIFQLIDPGYDAMPENENRYAFLGATGALGFVALLLLLFTGPPRSADLHLLGPLSWLNIAAVLLATKGGLGLVFAAVVSSMIRGYNRMSIYIAFFAILAVLLLLEHARRRWFDSARVRPLFLLLLGMWLAAGLVCQTPVTTIPGRADLARDFANDRDFVREIEEAMPGEAMVFQLPYRPFPQAGARRHKMIPYAHLRGYLHSKTLRWSYGAIHGRRTDRWQREVASRPAGELLEALNREGFGGIYVDRFGYTDGAAALEAELHSSLKVAPIVSEDRRFSFFRLPAAAEPHGLLTRREPG